MAGQQPPEVLQGALTHLQNAGTAWRSSPDQTLAIAEVVAGVRAADRALAAHPDLVDALVVKAALLRLQAAFEPGSPEHEHRLREVDALQRRAATRQKARAAGLA
jgi:hypothetical protein